MQSIFVLLLFLCLTDAQIEDPNMVCLKVPQDSQECFTSFSKSSMSQKAAHVTCLQQLLWNFQPDRNVTEQGMRTIENVIQAILDISGLHRRELTHRTRFGERDFELFSPSGYRLRSEYRTLTQRQRKRFHDAMNRLYEKYDVKGGNNQHPIEGASQESRNRAQSAKDGTIRVFARLHAMAFDPQHNGASFLPWHRVLLAVFEELLRAKDPTVALPYLDTSIDNEMDNPVNSIIWSDDYLGNGAGPVTTGPFAGWVTDQGNLERDYGRMSRLFNITDLRNVLTRCRLEEISRPTAEPSYNFEVFHGGVHVWIGGDMSAGATAAWDPVFYLHHAFVDYVWEVFRRRQRRRCRVDPSRDYPTSATDTHAFDTVMVGLRPLINGDGIADFWVKNFYGYDSTPSCPVCCRTCSSPRPMYCNRRRRLCVGSSRRQIPSYFLQFSSLRTSMMPSLQEEFFDKSEIEAIEGKMAPRNRGRLMVHPGNDGRTLETAIVDTFNAAIADRRERERSITSASSTGRSTPRRMQRWA